MSDTKTLEKEVQRLKHKNAELKTSLSQRTKDCEKYRQQADHFKTAGITAAQRADESISNLNGRLLTLAKASLKYAESSSHVQTQDQFVEEVGQIVGPVIAAEV